MGMCGGTVGATVPSTITSGRDHSVRLTRGAGLIWRGARLTLQRVRSGPRPLFLLSRGNDTSHVTSLRPVWRAPTSGETQTAPQSGLRQHPRPPCALAGVPGPALTPPTPAHCSARCSSSALFPLQTPCSEAPRLDPSRIHVNRVFHA
jgi:hypothetical protein